MQANLFVTVIQECTVALVESTSPALDPNTIRIVKVSARKDNVAVEFSAPNDDPESRERERRFLVTACTKTRGIWILEMRHERVGMRYLNCVPGRKTENGEERLVSQP